MMIMTYDDDDDDDEHDKCWIIIITIIIITITNSQVWFAISCSDFSISRTERKKRSPTWKIIFSFLTKTSRSLVIYR